MSEDEKWYANGLRFGCRQCGRCCTGDEGYVWVTEEEITRLAQAMNLSRDQFEEVMVRTVFQNKKSLRELPNGDCVLWDAESRGCLVYQDRPVQCRTWPFWPQNIDRASSWRKTAKFCHGCDNPRGKLYSQEEIEEQASQPFG